LNATIEKKVKIARKSLKTDELSALRMPGFKADASLYASFAKYRSSGSSVGTFGAVQPAAGLA
jgi:hypothetical protein